MTGILRGISTNGRDGSFDDMNEAEYTVVYKVRTTDKNDGQKVVLETFGIPRIGDIYVAANDFDPNAVVIGKTASTTESPNEWLVDVVWSTDTDEPPPQDPNPLNHPVEISYSFTTRQVILPGLFSSPGSPPQSGDFDAAILAPNGEPFDPQPEIEIAEPIVSFRKNVQSVNGAALLALANAVNDGPYFGAFSRQLKIVPPTPVRNWHKLTGFYWSVQYGMKYRWETWDIQVINQGTYYLDGSGDKTWEPDRANPTIVNLTSTGGKLAAGASPTYTRKRVYRELNFGQLGLGV